MLGRGMDEVDYGILLQLSKTPFASWEFIGRAVSRTGIAARRRWVRMQRSGLVKFMPVVDPRALNRDARLLVFEGEPLTAGLLDRILRVRDVAWCAGGYPDTLVVMTCPAPGSPPPVEELAQIVGTSPAHAIDPLPPRREGHQAISPIDLKILDALLDDFRASINRLCEVTGLAPKTVRRHRQALVDNGILLISPHGDATREAGLVYFSIHASLDPYADASRVQARGCERVAIHHNPPGVFLVGAAPTYVAAHEAERHVQAIPGVAHVHFHIPQGSGYAKERLQSWIRAERARWQRARRRWD